MAASVPSPVWSSVNFLEDGEKGRQAILNRPNHTLDNKAEWLRSTLELHISNASCFASKIGETLGSDCSTGSCVPCWGSPNYYGANDSYRSAISKLDLTLKVSNDSILSLAAAEAVLVINTGIPVDTPISVFAGHSFINGATHRGALSVFDDVVAANSDLLLSHASFLSVNESILTTHSSEILVLQSDVSSVSVFATTNAASIAINEGRIDAHDSTITDTILVDVSILQSEMVQVLSAINCITDIAANSTCSII